MTRPWIVRLLGRKGEPLPVPPPGAYTAPEPKNSEEQRAAA